MDRTVLKRFVDKELKQTISKRNYRLDRFWKLLGLHVDLIGDMETPAMIMEEHCLSCYVHNFNLIFTDRYEEGEEVYRVKLQQDQLYDLEKITEWLKSAEHRRVYRILMKDQPLYLVGYSFKEKPKRKGAEDDGQPEPEKYPVYGKFGAKVYFTKDYAEEIVNHYKLDYCDIV